MPRVCSRAWEVEAAKDGRLTGHPLLDHRAHVERCSDCARESRALRALSSRLRALAPPPLDEVGLRRVKRSVLQAINADLTGEGPARATRVRRGSIATAVALLAGLVAVGALRLHRPPDPGVEIRGGADTQWTPRAGGDARRIELRSGTLYLHVTRHDGERGVVVQVPDGEIVDIGTRFSVTVDGLRTRRVVVDEGRVVLHLRAGIDQEVGSGEAWEAPPAPPSTPGAGLAAPDATVGSASPPAAPSLVATLHGHAAPSRTKPPAAAAAVETPARADAGEEDSAYLSVVALLRAGRTEDARSAARSYLRDFPGGFREPEMRRLASGPP